MADFVRASHPIYGTRTIPSTWLTTYPGAWTELDPGEEGPGPDPLSMYVRDVDLDDAVADLLAPASTSAAAGAARAAFVSKLADPTDSASYDLRLVAGTDGVVRPTLVEIA